LISFTRTQCYTIQLLR